MAAVRHLGFALRLLRTTHKEYSWYLYRCAKFGWNWQCSFEDMRVSILYEFGLKMLIRAPFEVDVFGVKMAK